MTPCVCHDHFDILLDQFLILFLFRGRTNFILRSKEQETRLTLLVHDDDDDDDVFVS
jgi:hypothetical protein